MTFLEISRNRNWTWFLLEKVGTRKTRKIKNFKGSELKAKWASIKKRSLLLYLSFWIWFVIPKTFYNLQYFYYIFKNWIGFWCNPHYGRILGRTNLNWRFQICCYFTHFLLKQIFSLSFQLNFVFQLCVLQFLLLTFIQFFFKYSEKAF